MLSLVAFSFSSVGILENEIESVQITIIQLVCLHDTDDCVSHSPCVKDVSVKEAEKISAQVDWRANLDLGGVSLRLCVH